MSPDRYSAASGTRLVLLAATVLWALTLTACGGNSGSGELQPGYHSAYPASGSRGASSGVAKYLTVRATSKSATLKLVAGAGGALGGFNFDGYGKGQLKVAVPKGWKVTVECSNQASIPHSCAIVDGAQATAPAFPGAASPDPIHGLQPGSSNTFRFVAAKIGSYRIVCLVPGHEDAGMWDTFRIIASGSPSISAAA
jgi:hypothetical protein